MDEVEEPAGERDAIRGARFISKFEERSHVHRLHPMRLWRLVLGLGLLAFGIVNIFIPGPGGSVSRGDPEIPNVTEGPDRFESQQAPDCGSPGRSLVSQVENAVEPCDDWMREMLRIYARVLRCLHIL